MAGEVSAFRSRKLVADKSPNFITDQTEFVGKGDKPSNTRRSRSRSGNRIAPTVLSLADEHFYEDLEDYVKKMAVSNTNIDSGTDDVWSQLQQKESDLLLAAELGKALLDKNEELKKEQERLTEEYSRKLEVSPAISHAYTNHELYVRICFNLSVLA